MKTRKFFKRSIAMFFAVALTLCVLAPTVKVQAVEASPRNLMELRYITENGARLRKEPNPNSTILGLMYKGDMINFYTDERGTGDNAVYVRMTRDAEPREGYVHERLTSRDKPL